MPAETPARYVYFAPKAWSRRYGANFFTVRVAGFTVEEEIDPCFCAWGSPRRYASFELQCSAGAEAWTVRHRARDWFALWALVGASMDRSPSAPIPVPPVKTPLRHDVDDAFLKARAEHFAEFLDALLTQYNTGNPAMREEIEDWLDLPCK